MKKCLMIILDGLGDRSFAELGHQTPLQAACTPTLDRIARDGSNGLYHAACLGQALPSENAHFALFGFDPDDFPGRGPLEALGAGIALCDQDVAFLAHLTSLYEDGGILYTRQDTPPASNEEIAALVADMHAFVFEGIRIRFHPIKWIFGVLTMDGGATPFITDTNHMTGGWPLMAVVPWASHAGDEDTRKTASALTAYLRALYRKLTDHPVNVARRQRGLDPLNGLVTQRGGRLKKTVTFPERYGMKGLSIASGVMFKGMSAYLGLDFAQGVESTDPEAELAGRLRQAARALPNYDFIHVHTKAPDEAAHRKDPLLKKSVIEALDRAMARHIDPFLDDPDVLVVVTADHSTPSAGTLVHSGEPVPLVMHGCGARRDGVESFDEIHAAQGALGMVRDKEMMYLILNYLDRAKLRGIMDTPVDQAFWPGPYDRFSLDD